MQLLVIYNLGTLFLITLFDGIKKFPAGHYGIVKNSQLNIFKYWQLPNKENYEIKNKEYYSEKFSYLLEDSVNLRMNSDVPLVCI